MGAAKALKALVEIPEKKRSKEVKKTIDDGVEYFLKHHIHKKSHDLSKVSKPGWLRFLRLRRTRLFRLGILTKLGIKDERMQEAMDAVEKRQDKDGKWNLASTFNGRFQTNIEQKGKPSKWLTLNACRVIKRYYGRD